MLTIYRCGCRADGDNVAETCPMHGERETIIISERWEGGVMTIPAKDVKFVDWQGVTHDLSVGRDDIIAEQAARIAELEAKLAAVIQQLREYNHR
jgi:hypothetical protein